MFLIIWLMYEYMIILLILWSLINKLECILKANDKWILHDIMTREFLSLNFSLYLPIPPILAFFHIFHPIQELLLSPTLISQWIRALEDQLV